MQDHSLKVRPATAADLDLLRRFEQGVIEAERPFDQTLQPDPILYYNLEGMLQDARVALLVAEVEGAVIAAGYARLQEAEKPIYTFQQYAYLGFMYVEPHYRGQGINQKILDALKAWSRAQGVTELRLEVYADNAPAVRAYEKWGFQKHLIEMRIDIAETE